MDVIETYIKFIHEVKEKVIREAMAAHLVSMQNAGDRMRIDTHPFIFIEQIYIDDVLAVTFNMNYPFQYFEHYKLGE